MAREECLRCQKPQATCVCDGLPRLANRTGVLVLQHPRERAHPLGTARFVELGLARATVHVAHGLSVDRALDAAEGPLALLFPGEGAVLPDALPDPPRTLVVVDGTWSTARTLLARNPRLLALPRVTLPETARSRYRIRREPRDGYVSTLEAVLATLAALDPELPDASPLLEAFDAMIDRQIAAVGTGPRRVRVRGKRPYVGVPNALGEDFARLVALYADLSRKDARGRRRVLRVVAERVHDGAQMDLLVGATPNADELPPDAPELAGEPRIREDELAARLGAFVPTGGVLAAWNGTLAERFAASAGCTALDLAGAYRTRHGAGRGVLDRVIAELGLAPTPSLPGRAGRRLAHAVALARFLHANAVRAPRDGESSAR